MPEPLTAEQVRHLLRDGAPAAPTPGELAQILRFLVQGQADLESKQRQLKSAMSRAGR